MRYIAPMILSTQKATKVVQGTVQKIGLNTDNFQPSTAPAYEADE
jgi:hypothetical protein